MHLEAYGTEINPSAHKLAKIFGFINCSQKKRSSILININKILNQLIGEPMFLVHHEPSQIDQQLKRLLIESLSSITDTHEREIFEALVILLDFYKNDVSAKKIFDKFNKINNIIVGLPFSKNPIDAFNCDARNTPLGNKTIDIVLTSPPYINVFNYHQNYRASVEALGWDVLSVARSEIGSNRKNRGNRILTVIQYCIDMAQCLKEMSRILKDSGRIIMIVGRESCIRKTPFYNAKIISEIGVRSVGLELIKRQDRVFKNKFGSMIYEDILHFSSPSKEITIIDPENEAKNIAKEMLIQSLSYAPNDSKMDIKSAIDEVEDVKPSPIYESNSNLFLNKSIKQGITYDSPNSTS